MNIEPAYPAPPGGTEPALNLAGSDGFNVASGSARQWMPDPGKPTPYEPTLSGSVEMGGINPDVRYNHLNLAGEMGVPTPQELASPGQEGAIVTNDYTMPDMAEVPLQPFNLDAGITHYDEMTPDPAHPDLTEYCLPHGLTIHNFSGDRAGLFTPDPPLTDLIDYEVPDGVGVIHNPLDPEPGVPDLQSPDLEPQMRMDPDDRPGELDDDALDTMHTLPGYKQVEEKAYPDVMMDQSGMNNRRSRKNTLLMHGLDAEESGKEINGMGTPPKPTNLKRRNTSVKGFAGDYRG